MRIKGLVILRSNILRIVIKSVGFLGVKKVHLSQHVMVHIIIFELTFIVYFKLFYVDKEVSVCQFFLFWFQLKSFLKILLVSDTPIKDGIMDLLEQCFKEVF